MPAEIVQSWSEVLGRNLRAVIAAEVKRALDDYARAPRLAMSGVPR